MFSYQNLIVYQRTLEFVTLLPEVIGCLPPGNSDLINQLRRASQSIALNIAEGAGKIGRSDKRRFYSIARGSTLECAAIFDLILTMKLVLPETLDKPSGKLREIAAMLGAMVLR